MHRTILWTQYERGQRVLVELFVLCCKQQIQYLQLHVNSHPLSTMFVSLSIKGCGVRYVTQLVDETELEMLTGVHQGYRWNTLSQAQERSRVPSAARVVPHEAFGFGLQTKYPQRSRRRVAPSPWCSLGSAWTQDMTFKSPCLTFTFS